MIITVATGNLNKLEEIKQINPYSEIKIKKIEGKFNPEETGQTFEENAIIKARAASQLIGGYAFADDSGLCVEALKGEPGIHTARYAPTQNEKIVKMLKEMEDVPFEKRGAKFICSMVLTDKNGKIIYKTQGEVHGFIAQKAAGCGGFGYDPIFYLPEYKKTIAQLADGEKNKVSHRAKALIPMLEFINNNIKNICS